MTNLDLQIKNLDTAVWEMSEVFKGLSDADVWVRAHPKLLSVGEIAAHVAYWEAQSFLGDAVESPLVDSVNRYYTATVQEPFVLDMGAEALYAEVKRIHEACKASVLALQPDLEGKSPYREGWTWGFVLEYQIFHVSYHVGQMYSVRHLMGHETADN